LSLARSVTAILKSFIKRNAIAVGHSNFVSLFDQSSLQLIAVLKAADDVRVLSHLNGFLIAGGKGGPSAISVWDGRSNKYPQTSTKF
jgi:hypothetical protein